MQLVVLQTKKLTQLRNIKQQFYKLAIYVLVIPWAQVHGFPNIHIHPKP